MPGPSRVMTIHQPLNGIDYDGPAKVGRSGIRIQWVVDQTMGTYDYNYLMRGRLIGCGHGNHAFIVYEPKCKEYVSSVCE